MPDTHIHVTTSVDTAGLHPLEEALRRYKELSDAIAQNFSAFRPPDAPGPGAPAAAQPLPRVVGDTGPIGPTWTDARAGGSDAALRDLIPHLDRLADALEKVPQATAPTAGGGGSGLSYNLNTIPGLENWTQNVLEPAEPVIEAMETAGQGPIGAGSRTVRQARTRATRAQASAQSGAGSIPSSVSASAFHALYTLATAPYYVPETDRVFQQAQMATGWSAEQVHAVAGVIAEQEIHGVQPAQIRYQLNQMVGGSGGSGAPPSGPSARSGGFGDELAGAAGGLVSKYLPFASVGGAALFGASQLEGGWANYGAQAGPLSDLYKQVGTASNSLEQFRMALDSGSTALGVTMPQITSIATTLVPILGDLSTSGLAQAITTVASFAQGFGVPVSQATQIFSSAASLGLTSGTGAPMTAAGLSATLGSMGALGDMLGRTGPAATGYLTALQAVEQQGGNLTPTGATGVANILTWMSASGLQGLQGPRGASVFSSLNSAYTSALTSNTVGSGLILAAIQAADPRLQHNPQLLIKTLGQGLGATLPGTQTIAFDAILKSIQADFGTSDFDYGFTTAFGTPLNTSAEFAQLYHAHPALPNTQTAAADEAAHHWHLTAGGQALFTRADDTTSPQALRRDVTRFVQNGGTLTPALIAALRLGDPAKIQTAFGDALSAQHYTGLTGFQRFQATESEIGQGLSHLVGPLVSTVGGAASRRLGQMSPLAVGGADLGVIGALGTAGFVGMRYGLRGLRGLLARSRGASSSEVAAADAADAADASRAAPDVAAMRWGGSEVGDVADTASRFADWMPLVGTGVSMALDVPTMLKQIREGHAGKGIGGLVGTGGGAFGGMMAGAALAAPLDPFTFGLASVVGGGLGALAGSDLGKHFGTWLGGRIQDATTGTPHQYGTVTISQLQIQQLSIDALLGTSSAASVLGAATVTSGTGHSATVGPAANSGSGSPSVLDDVWQSLAGAYQSVSRTVSTVLGVPSISGAPSAPGLTAAESRWLPDIRTTLAHLPHKSALLTPALMMTVLADQSQGNPAATYHDTNGTEDAGLMQINSSNWAHYGLTKNPWAVGANLRAGATILNQDLLDAGTVSGALYAYSGSGPAAAQDSAKMVALLHTIAAALKEIARTQKKTVPVSSVPVITRHVTGVPTRS